MTTGGYLVAGLGQAGNSALQLLVDRGATPLLAWESGQSPHADDWAGRGVFVSRSNDGADVLDRLSPGGIVVKSPGLSPENELLVAARERGLQVIDELELAWCSIDRPVVGVTGTNGKSTTSKLIATAIGDGGWAGNTELGVPASAARGEDWLVYEVSSFQLQFAPTFHPQVAVFTNLTRDHLTYHHSLEEYGAAKASMFISRSGVCGHAVINIDDSFGHALAVDVAAAGVPVTTFGFIPEADIQTLDFDFDAASAMISLSIFGEPFECSAQLPGRHNALNLTAAIGAAIATGMSAADATEALQGASPPPGRAEFIDEGQPFSVVVDYAHNGDGIEQALTTFASIAHDRDAELHTVFGPVSDPDISKESESAAAVARHSDHITVTPGSMGKGDPIKRTEEMHAMLERDDASLIFDRAQAIGRTIGNARPGDIVAILGHGTLRRLLDGSTSHAIPHDDRDVARVALSRLALS